MTDIIPIGGDGNTLLRITASCEKGSEHPLGQTIVRHAEDLGIPLSAPDSFTAIPGYGIEARTGGTEILVGNRRLLEQRGISLGELAETGEHLAAAGKTPMYVSADGNARGVIAVSDTIKEGSREAVEALRDMGIAVVMVTGDNRKTADAIAGQPESSGSSPGYCPRTSRR